MRTVYLICPDPRNQISGGHRYNLALIDQAHRNAYPLIHREPPSKEEMALADDGSLWIWDSLYLSRLAEFQWDPPRVGGQIALLHGWPVPNLEPEALWALLKSLQGVIVTGRGLGRQLAALLAPIPVFVIEPGIAEAFARRPRFRARQPSLGLRLVTVANLLPSKRPLELLEVLAGLQGEWVFDWVGVSDPTTPFAGAVRQRIDGLGLDGRVCFRPPMSQADLAQWLPSRDLMISASALETYGMAIAEAQALGLPVLTTRVGEADRLVQTGRTGWVIDSDLEAMPSLLQALVDSPSRLSAVASFAGWQTPRSWNLVYQELIEVLAWMP